MVDNFEKASLVSRLGCPKCGERSLAIICSNTTDKVFVACQNEQCDLFGYRNPVTSSTQIPVEEDIDKVCKLQEIAFDVKMQKKRANFNLECVRRFKESKKTKGLIEAIRREKEFIRSLRAHRFYTKGVMEKQEFVAADPTGDGLVRIRTMNERKKEIARVGYHLYGNRLALARMCKQLDDFRKTRRNAMEELAALLAKAEKAKGIVQMMSAKQIWRKSPWKEIFEHSVKAV